MQKIIISVLLIILSFCVRAQKDLKKYVQQSAVSISTIEPDSLNFTDLEAIGNAIGNSRIVMLGEQDHGDAPVFLAKTRLIKYLHEKKGFNILAFESDFFGLNYGWEQLSKKKKYIDTFLRKNIFPIWTYCNTCTELFYEYIPKTYTTASPLTITGFDNQIILDYSSGHLIHKLDSVFKLFNLPVTKNAAYSTIILPAIDSLQSGYSKTDYPDDFYERCGGYLHEIKQQLGKELKEDDFWITIINNLIQENIEFRLRNKDYWLANNARDSQMAQNLQWLARRKFPNEKIIVWAANAHIAKYVNWLNSIPPRELIAMGSYFTRDSAFLNETYTIGFTSYEGQAGRLGMNSYTVPKPKPNGFENWINESYEYAFVDFKNFTGRSEPFYLKGLGHRTFFKADWTNIYDGIFYIKNMYPCEK